MLLYFLLFAAKRACNGWWSYSVTVILIFVLSIFIPLALSPGFYFSILGLLFIFESGIILLLGMFIGYRVLSHDVIQVRRFDPSIFMGKDLQTLWLIGLLCGCVAVGLTLRGDNVIVFEGNVYESIASIAVKNASDRYKGIAEPTIIQSVLLAGNYFSCLLGGAILAASHIENAGKSKNVVFVALPILTLIAFGLFQNTKANILYGGALYFSGYLSIRILGPNPNLKLVDIGKLIFKGAMLLSVVLLLLIAMQSMRYGVLFLSGEEIYTMIVEYAFAHVSGFQFWFDFYYDEHGRLYFGAKTFAGVFNLFGDSIQGGSTLLQNKQIGMNLVTNVDTAFADLIMDFGVLGAMVAMFFFGLFIGVLDHLRLRRRVICAPLVAPFVVFFLWFFTTSVLNYSSIYMNKTND